VAGRGTGVEGVVGGTADESVLKDKIVHGVWRRLSRIFRPMRVREGI